MEPLHKEESGHQETERDMSEGKKAREDILNEAREKKGHVAQQIEDNRAGGSGGSGGSGGVRGEFIKPSKMVATLKQLSDWKTSQAFADVVGFILELNEKIKGKKRSSPHERSPKVECVVKFLARCRELVKEMPPVEQSSRFGNKTFRDWHKKMVEESQTFHSELLGKEFEGAYVEVGYYWEEAFGNLQRIDYGTGHELNFVCWMCVGAKLGVFGDIDKLALVFDVFHGYLCVMRDLQSIYWLEPAGSKGVWGLDDYQFLPFFWGASQLIGQGHAAVADFTNKDVAGRMAEDYLFMEAIAFIYKMKTGPFGEHSPLLNDISAVSTWSKVVQGLIRMYNNEVLGKFPVVQHVYFGSILSFAPSPMDHPVRTAKFRNMLGEQKTAV